MKHFGTDLLETLVAFADTGTLARTAEIVGRTAPAVTAQMQRLGEIAEVPLLEAVGRRRVLTEAGERLVGHARRMLAAEREAMLSLAGVVTNGNAGLGMTQDFTDDALPAILNDFARTHPRVRLDVRVGRSGDLSEDFRARRIDVLLAMRSAVEMDEVAVVREPMIWLCAEQGVSAFPKDALPLAVLDAPCGFREAAITALDERENPYRIAVTSPSLAGIIASVKAGLAVTARTPRWLGKGLVAAPKSMALPALPEAEFSVRVRKDALPAAQRLGAVLVEHLHAKPRPFNVAAPLGAV